MTQPSSLAGSLEVAEPSQPAHVTSGHSREATAPLRTARLPPPLLFAQLFSIWPISLILVICTPTVGMRVDNLWKWNPAKRSLIKIWQHFQSSWDFYFIFFKFTLAYKGFGSWPKPSHRITQQRMYNLTLWFSDHPDVWETWKRDRKEGAVGNTADCAPTYLLLSSLCSQPSCPHKYTKGCKPVTEMLLSRIHTHPSRVFKDKEMLPKTRQDFTIMAACHSCRGGDEGSLEQDRPQDAPLTAPSMSSLRAHAASTGIHSQDT